MKNIFITFLLLKFAVCQSQITLEQAYEAKVNRVLFEYSGEKYYIYSLADQEINLYNSDHTFWKSIYLETPPGGAISRINVSEGKINPDNQLEIIYTYNDPALGNTYITKVINEQGTVYLNVSDVSYAYISEIEGLANTLIAHKAGMHGSMMFSLPNFIQLGSYQGYVDRINLEYAGEKYHYVYNNKLRILHTNNSVWKAINMPLPISNTISSIPHISQSKINPDSLIEILYTCYNSNNHQITTRLISENGILLTVPNSHDTKLSVVENAPNKLIIDFHGNPSSTQIYSLPDLNIEHTYDLGKTERTDLEFYGERYYEFDRSNKKLRLYYPNHTLWKEINLTSPLNSTLVEILNVSAIKLNTDPKLDVCFSYITIPALQYEGTVINEQGVTLLIDTNASKMEISEIENAPNKLIVYAPNGISSRVYKVDNYLNTNQHSKENTILIHPNPTTQSLHITANNIIFDGAKIINMAGQTVLEFHNNISNIDVKFLPNGMYTLILSHQNKYVGEQKFIIK